MGQHYVIMIRFSGNDSPDKDVIEHELDNVSVDWLRFGSGQYVIYTEDGAGTIYDGLKKILGSKDNFIVIEANIKNRRGWGSKVVVDWITKY